MPDPPGTEWFKQQTQKIQDPGPAAEPVLSKTPGLQGKYYPAQKNLPYPSNEEAESAIKNEFAYGKDWERYFDNSIAKIFSTRDPRTLSSYLPAAPHGTIENTMSELQSKSNIIDDPKTLAAAKNAFARAALATNRHPISALGFRPDKTTLDIVTEYPAMMGLQQQGQMYANQGYAKAATDFHAITHESIHNGLEILKKERPDLMQGLDQQTEELLVRRIMDTVMGNPEEKYNPQLVHQSRNVYRPGSASDEMLNNFTRAAQEIIGRRQGGPR
jgi:hypothetical protein